MTTKLSVTLIDDFNRMTTRVVGMETQTLLADYVTAYGVFFTALEAITDLGCVKANLIIPVTDPSWAVTSDVNVDTGATASGLLVAGSGKKGSIKIPGVKLSLVGSDGSIAITGAIATYLALFEDAADFNFSDGEQASAWIKATLDR
jgi:hypothetical protein